MMKKLLLTLFLILFAVSTAFAYDFKGEDGIEVINKTPGIYVIKINTKKFGSKIQPLVDWGSASSIYAPGSNKLVLN
jgi:hypothetical protein